MKPNSIAKDESPSTFAAFLNEFICGDENNKIVAHKMIATENKLQRNLYKNLKYKFTHTHPDAIPPRPVERSGAGRTLKTLAKPNRCSWCKTVHILKSSIAVYTRIETAKNGESRKPTQRFAKTKYAMAKTRNKVELIGYLGNDPEIITLASGKRKAILNLATHHPIKRENDLTEWKSTWHRIILWEKKIPALIHDFIKGSHVLVEGRLEYRTYQDNKGHTRYVTEIIGWQLLNLDR